jgi:hypothetical protein
VTTAGLLRLHALFTQQAVLGQGQPPVEQQQLELALPPPQPLLPRLTLIDLPTLFHELLGAYRSQPCRHCMEAPFEPALCLACGTVCCGGAFARCKCAAALRDPRALFQEPFSARDNMSVGECTAHAAMCSGGGGVPFLLLGRRAASGVLLVSGALASDYPSPYVDAFGEQDINCKRGRALALCPQRYASLSALWAGGGIAREVITARSLAHQVWNLGVF